MHRTQCGDLFSTQEEADARILLHAAHMTPRIVICSPDTDVAILATYLSPKLGEISEMYFYTGVGDKRRFIDIHGLACALGEILCELLLPFHVLTGCDSTSCIGKLGKIKPWRILKADPGKFAALSDLGTSLSISDLALQTAEKTGLCCIYRP